MAKASPQRHKRKRHSWKPSALPFNANYNDHFETPEAAYRDILPLLDHIQENRDAHQLYDPFYCNGRAAVLLKRLGFTRVVHECRDFYKDVENDAVPEHDTLITNPPYSDDHKEQCVSFALEQLRAKGRPFFILMPNYVASRDYFRKLLLANPEAGIVYVIPSISYEYDHPEGTGHATSPFDSIWYCGLGAARAKSVEEVWDEHWNGCNERRDRPRLVKSMDDLARLKAIPTGKRPNPRQRRKQRRKQLEGATQSPVAASTVDNARTSTPGQANNGKRKSRHRNEKGERKRKRF